MVLDLDGLDEAAPDRLCLGDNKQPVTYGKLGTKVSKTGNYLPIRKLLIEPDTYMTWD
jgi:hypothetical protein